MIKVFEGGTCNNSIWRTTLEEGLKDYTEIELFNPVVDDWNEAAQKREDEYKKNCNYQLFVITPKMTGVFSIAEAVECSNKFPKKCIFCILNEDDGSKFTNAQMKSLIQVGKMIIANGGVAFSYLEAVANYLIKHIK